MGPCHRLKETAHLILQEEGDPVSGAVVEREDVKGDPPVGVKIISSSFDIYRSVPLNLVEHKIVVFIRFLRPSRPALSEN